jgi:hypothetical protein
VRMLVYILSRRCLPKPTDETCTSQALAWVVGLAWAGGSVVSLQHCFGKKTARESAPSGTISYVFVFPIQVATLACWA